MELLRSSSITDFRSLCIFLIDFKRKERAPRNASCEMRNLSFSSSSGALQSTSRSNAQKRKSSAPIKIKINVGGTFGGSVIQERYNCSYCPRSYLRRSECRKHERIHTGNNPYYCKLCDVHNLKPSKLKAHLLTKSHIRRATINAAATGIHTCSMCLEEFRSLSSLQDHERIKHGPHGSTPVKSKPVATTVANECKETPENLEMSAANTSNQVTDGKADDNVGNETTQQEAACSSQQDDSIDQSADNTAQADTSGNSLTVQPGDGNTAATNCQIITDPATGKQRYQCQQCVKSFVSRKMFRMHLRIHNGTNPYYCPVCNQYFLKRVELKKHLNTRKHLDRVAENIAAGIEVVEIDPSSIEPPTNKIEIKCLGDDITYQCPHCPKKFLSKRSLNLHEKVHLGTSQHFCSTCNKQFHRKIHLQYHKWSVHTENLPFKCDVCSARFRVPYDLKKHKLIHPSSRICNTCKKEFDSASLLTEHLKESSSCIGYKCGICECIFMDQKAYDKHIVRHNEQHMVEITENNSEQVETPKYLCKHCKKEFGSKKSCREHLSVHLGTSRHFCDLCNQYFAKRNHLVSHQASAHSQECPYRCDVCLASFKLLSNLKIHMSTHVSNKKCKTCEQEFDSVLILKEHLKDSPECLSFKCEECDLIFIDKKKHKEHLKVKHGVGADKRRSSAVNQHGNSEKFKTPRNHVCQLCSEAFTQSTALRQHMEWHNTGKYPNECPECGRPFFSKWKLDRHITTVHMGLRQYECEICSKDFKSKTALKLHVMKDHEQTTIKCDTCSKEFMTTHGYEQHKAHFCKSTTTRKKESVAAKNDANNSELDLDFSSITAGISSTNSTHYAADSEERESQSQSSIDLVIARPSTGSYSSNTSVLNYSSSSNTINSKVCVPSPFLVENIIPQQHGVNESEVGGSNNQKTEAASVSSMPSISSFFQPSYPNIGAAYSANMGVDAPSSSGVLDNTSGAIATQNLQPHPHHHPQPVGSIVSSGGKSLMSSYPYRQQLHQGNELTANQHYFHPKGSRLNTPLASQSSEQIPPIQPRGQEIHHNLDYHQQHHHHQQRPPSQQSENEQRLSFAQVLLQNQYQYL